MKALQIKRGKVKKSIYACFCNKTGFTLIEIIVGLGIMCIIILGIYMMSGFNQKTYARIDSRVNTQSDFRLMMDYLKKQIGTASYLDLRNDVQTTVPADYRTIYVVTTGGKGALKKKEGNTVSSVYTADIPGLVVQFERTASRSFKITLKATGDLVLSEEVFSQNATIADISASTTIGTVFEYAYLKPVN